MTDHLTALKARAAYAKGHSDNSRLVRDRLTGEIAYWHDVSGTARDCPVDPSEVSPAVRAQLMDGDPVTVPADEVTLARNTVKMFPSGLMTLPTASVALTPEQARQFNREENRRADLEEQRQEMPLWAWVAILVSLVVFIVILVCLYNLRAELYAPHHSTPPRSEPVEIDLAPAGGDWRGYEFPPTHPKK